MRVSTMRNLSTIILGAAAAGLLLFAAGCALKSPPDREALRKDALRDIVPPLQWSAPGGAPGAVAGGWLRSFNEPRLDALVDEALIRNVNLRIAAAQVEQARASLRIAGGALAPAVGVLARGGGDLSGDGSGLTGALVSASWEIDLWGRVRYGQRAASGQLASAELDYAYARQSMAALVAKSWFVAAESALQRQLARDMLAVAERLVEVAQVRRRVGNGDEMDVVLAGQCSELSRRIAQARFCARSGIALAGSAGRTLSRRDPGGRRHTAAPATAGHGRHSLRTS